MSDQTDISERVKPWHQGWTAGRTDFHQSNIHPMLYKYLDKLVPDGKPSKIFFPLCGKAVDMKWLADKGFNVVGVDGVKMALEQFFTESGLEWTETSVPQLGAEAKLLVSKEKQIKLYCGDMMSFTPDIESNFDCIWDRGSLVALNRQDIKGYVQLVKNLLKPGGRILVEVMEYDVAIMNDEGMPPPPPPFPMPEAEMKSLYEPECTVEFLDRADIRVSGRDVKTNIYLLTKK